MKMKNAYQIETVEYKGHTIRLGWFYDQDCEPPWEHEDGHGPVSDWTTRDKRPGERILHQDGRSVRYYDFAEAIKIAKRDGWDAPPYKTGTKAQQAVRAVEQDFEYLQRWCRDDWHWCGYAIEIEGTSYEDSLWGIDSDSTREHEQEAFNVAKHWLDNELTEAHDASCRDLVTV